MNNEVLDPHLTTKIVSSYVRRHTVGADQVSDLITSVHRALGGLGQPVHPQEVLTPAVSARRSVHHDYVVCLDCGYRGKALRRHIATRHGLSRDDYLKRWELKRDHPLTAPAYSEQRATMARAFGLGRKSKAKAVSAVTRAVSVSADADLQTKAKPTRKRNTGPASKSDVMSEAVAEDRPAAPRRSRSKSAAATV
jgi:predicted transcriptional regulator